MQPVKPIFAANPFKFGRGPARVGEVHQAAKPLLPALSEDVKLFATTFLAGFLFVSIVIG